MTPIQEKFRLSRVTNWIIILSAVIFSLIYFQNILKPFVLSMVFWYLISDLRNQLSKLKIGNRFVPRWLSTTVAFLILFMFIELTSEILTRNAEQIINKIPNYSAAQINFIDEIGHKLGIQDLENIIQGQLGSINIANILTNFLDSLTSTVGNIVMIIVYMIFLLIEEAGFAKKMHVILSSKSDFDNLAKLLRRINVTVNKYVTLKTLISLLTAGLSYIVMMIFKVDFPFLWAFIIFVLNFIPYVGSLIATILPASYAIFQFGSFMSFVWVFLSIEMVQIFVGNYLEPKFTGRSLNLSPLAVVIALTLWGSIWGILGMLLSVPIMSILTIILAQFPETRFLAILLSETGDIKSLLIEPVDEPVE